MLDPAPLAPTETSLQLARLDCAGSSVAVDVARVREVVRMAELRPLPESPAMIEGVIDLRGRLVPVVDLARALTLGRATRVERAHIVVVVYEGASLGLWVDAATEVMSIEGEALEPLPVVPGAANQEVLKGVVRDAQGAPVLWLCVEALVARIAAETASGAEREVA